MQKLFISLLLIFIMQIAFADDIVCDTSDKAYIALYEINKYDCAVGYYLPANTDGCVECPENSYCVGGIQMAVNRVRMVCVAQVERLNLTLIIFKGLIC